MAQPFQCSDCGTVLPEGQPKGLCPRCALSGLLKADDWTSGPHPQPLAHPMGEGGRRSGEGRTFGDYELLEEIARGGMGVVFKARQKSLNRIVAVKLLLAGPHTSDDFIKRFRVEASAAAALQHPNIVAIHEVGVHEGEHFIAMEFVDGPNLAKLVREQPLSAKQAARYLKTIAEAIHFAHERGILHRDLKPSNVLLDAHDQPRVTDFGLAKRVGTESQPATDFSQLTLTGQVMGSPSYMPPEQASGRRGAMSRRSDVYSLGAMLYHLLTGRPPFGGGSPAEALRQVETQEPVSLQLLNPAVPLDLETICLKCLEKEPARRYHTATELVEELGRYLNDENIRARPIGRPEKLWRWCRRRPAIAGLAAAVVVLLASVAIGASVFAVRLGREVDAKELARKDAVAKGAEAVRRSEEAELVTRFVTGAFRRAHPKEDGRTITVVQTLERAVQQLDRDFTNHPGRRASLQRALGNTYHGLGLPKEAIALAEKALDYYRANLGLEHNGTLSLISELSSAYSDVGRFADSLRLREEALAAARSTKGLENEYTVRAMHDVASSYHELGRKEEALQLREEVLALRRKVSGPEVPDTLAAMNNLAVSYAAARRLDEAIALREKLLELRPKVSGPDHPDTIGAIYGLALAYSVAGRHADALALREKVVPLSRKVNGPTHAATLSALLNLAVSYNNLGRREEGLKLEVDVLSILRQEKRLETPEGLMALYNLSNSYFKTGRKVEALALREESLTLHRKVLGPTHSQTLNAMRELLASYTDAGREVEARVLREEILSHRPAKNAPP